MHTDIRTLEDGTLIEGDLCIVGAGAAGLSIALQWVDSSRRVILLEGGGFDLEAQLQDLYRGQIIGEPYYPLEAARLHYFGGTTGHWVGFCAPMDDIDFEARDWVADSGWPLNRADLDGHYQQAHRILELGPYEYGVQYWEQRNEAARLPLNPDAVWTKMWQFSPPTRFGTKYRRDILVAPNVHLFTHANVCAIHTAGTPTEVRELAIRTFEHKAYRVRARAYVLACSTLQNARLLLASCDDVSVGLGNQHDQVGRYFMEHVEMPAAELVLTRPRQHDMSLYAFNFGSTRARGELALAPRLQRTHRILNGTASLRPGALGEEPLSTFQLNPPAALAALQALTKEMPPRQPERRSKATMVRVFQCHSRQEQAPNPASRVLLSTERDALGMPRVKLNWQLTALEKRSMRRFYEVLGTEMGRSGIGRVRIRDWLLSDDASWPSFLSGGWHHMGTTRMHTNPRHGVVDSNCRVHGSTNLYVAGASVFPTGGAVNPTLTLVALSLRLSAHLAGTLS